MEATVIVIVNVTVIPDVIETKPGTGSEIVQEENGTEETLPVIEGTGSQPA